MWFHIYSQKIGKNGKNRRAVCKNVNKAITSMSSELLHRKENNNISNKKLHFLGGFYTSL
jgi:hypothetical protein